MTPKYNPRSEVLDLLHAGGLGKATLLVEKHSITIDDELQNAAVEACIASLTRHFHWTVPLFVDTFGIAEDRRLNALAAEKIAQALSGGDALLANSIAQTFHIRLDENIQRTVKAAEQQVVSSIEKASTIIVNDRAAEYPKSSSPTFSPSDIVKLNEHPEAFKLTEQGSLCAQRDDWQDAVTFFKRANDLLPDLPLLLVKLSGAYFESGNVDEAERVAKRGTQLNPADAMAWVEFGRCRLHSSDAQGCIDAMDNALQHAPDYAMAYANRAAAYLILRQTDDALLSALDAIKRDENNELGLYYAGAILAEDDDPKQRDVARQLLERILEINPYFQGASEVRRLLESM